MHRNSQKRIIEKHLTYFITTVTSDRYPYFENEIFCDLFILQLEYCKEIYDFDLYGFVIIYDHIHLLIRSDDEKNDFSKIMFSIKKNFSMNANRILGYINLKNNAHERAQSIARVQRENDMHEKVNNFIMKYKMKNHNIPKFQWQKSYHDHYIRNQHDFQNHMNYINQNHLKHNLPTNWKYIGYNYQELLNN